MEILYQQSVNLERVADLCEMGIQRERLEPRDQSLWHVTSLLKAARLIIKGNPVYPEGVAAPSGIMSLGRIWETAMDCYMADFAEELGGAFLPDVTYVEDDVCGSLDGVMVIPKWEKAPVYECKLRFTLNMDVPLDHLRQIRAYCHLAGTDLVCYVSGHISTTPPLAQATLRLIHLTQQSIEETWQGIMNTKRYLESLGIAPVTDEGAGVPSSVVPRVLNKKTDEIPSGAVYVGRPSKWGNIFKDMPRAEMVRRHEEWMNEQIGTGNVGHGTQFKYNLDELRGKDLVCFCAPLPCHADILLELANK